MSQALVVSGANVAIVDLNSACAFTDVVELDIDIFCRGGGSETSRGIDDHIQE